MLTTSSFAPALLVLWAAFAPLSPSAGLFGISPSHKIPSMTPYHDLDINQTISFTKRPGATLIGGPVRAMVVTAYTDRPDLWTQQRYLAAMRLAQWYLARCRVHLPIMPLKVLPRGTLTQQKLVKWKISRPLCRTSDRFETFLFFTDQVQYEWGKPPKRVRLLGVSAKVWVKGKSNKWHERSAVWTRLSPVYTTLAHEIGHRLGLKHTRRPYHLMLNGAGVRSSAEILFTSLLGYFAPRRFLFSRRQCGIMQSVLFREQKRRLQEQKARQTQTPKPILRLRPIQPLSKPPTKG